MIEPPKITFYLARQSNGILGNFYPCKNLIIYNKPWPNTEQFFQAMKFKGTDMEERIRLANSPKEAFYMARSAKLTRQNWDKERVDVMAEALYQKFSQNPEFKEFLINTQGFELVEQTDNDRFWGNGGDGSGKNMLGILLMNLRSMFLNRNQSDYYSELLHENQKKRMELEEINQKIRKMEEKISIQRQYEEQFKNEQIKKQQQQQWLEQIEKSYNDKEELSAENLRKEQDFEQSKQEQNDQNQEQITDDKVQRQQDLQQNDEQSEAKEQINLDQSKKQDEKTKSMQIEDSNILDDNTLKSLPNISEFKKPLQMTQNEQERIEENDKMIEERENQDADKQAK